jgi:hypothetical protein
MAVHLNFSLQKTLLILVGLNLFIACDKSTLPPEEPISDDGFFVVCEGNFNWGNASISSYDEGKDQETQEYFKAVNGFSLGDIAQSMFETDENYIIVVNNSGKIEIVAKDDFLLVHTLDEFESPRFFQSINDSMAYVSDLFADQLYIVDYAQGTMMGSIPVNSWSEQMVQHEDSVYVCLYGSQTIGIINSLSHQVVSEIDLAMSPSQIRIDSEGKIWVLASSWGNGSIIYRIDPETRMIEGEWIFEEANTIIQLETSTNGTQIYLLSSQGEVYKFSNLSSTIIDPIFSVDLEGMYGLDIDDQGGIYICQAYDFVQNGSVRKFNESGVEQYSVTTGIGPNSIVFR